MTRVSWVMRLLIGVVWFANGLFCKVLGWVPRHEEIVARILGEEYAGEIGRVIGVMEIGLAVWVWSGWRSRVCAILQMALVAAMNVMEFVLAKDLLLWGGLNGLFAALFIGLVYYYEFGFKGRGSRGA
jgi:hypothetical protein